MSNLIILENVRRKKSTTKCTKKYDYLSSIEKLEHVDEYVKNINEINNIQDILINLYHVPIELLATLIEGVKERVAMEYELKNV